MKGRPGNPDDRHEDPDAGSQDGAAEEDQEASGSSGFAVPHWARSGGERGRRDAPGRSGFAAPRWARPADGSAGPRGWRGRLTLLRRRLVWPAAAIIALFAVWSNYPFIPNPWVALFGQPGGDASAVSSQGQWAMRGANPQGTNFIPGIPETALPQGIAAFAVEVNGGVRSAPAVAGGALLIGGQSRLAAYDAASGEMLWERPVNGPAHGTPAAAGGLMYLGMLDKRVVALYPDSGELAWEYEGDSPFPGAVAVQGGIVYAPSRGGGVHALDALTGDLLWKVDAGAPVIAPAAVSGGRMFAASTAGVLFIRNSRTGDKRARIRTSGALVYPPVAEGGRVYLLSEGDLMAFDASIREIPGRYPAELVWAQLWLWGFPMPAPPKHAGLLWRAAPGEGKGSFAHPPAVTPEALYAVTDGGEVVALDRRNGGVLWRMQAGPPIVASPVAAGRLLFLAHADGSIRAIDRVRREQVWSLSLGSPSVAPLSYAGGGVYVHTEDGRLHAIR